MDKESGVGCNSGKSIGGQQVCLIIFSKNKDQQAAAGQPRRMRLCRCTG